MAQSIATIDLIRRSMYLINAVAAGEMPADLDLNDALITLNEMIDGLNIQPLAIYSSVDTNLTLTPGLASYDWGTTAVPPNFTSERPNFVNTITCVRSGVSTPVSVVTKEEYDLIPVKATQSSLIERAVYINSFPNGKLLLYPVPSEAVVLAVNVGNQLLPQATLQSIMSFPPGYMKMLRYNLAVELWPEYTNTTTDIDSVKEIAKSSLARVKIANNQVPVANFGDIPNVEISRSWDWREG